MRRSELPSLAATDIFGTPDMMQKLTGGQAIVRSLVSHGVDTVFGVPGVQTYGFFDALHEARDRIRVLYPRHEQATAYMAFGYAKTTGRAGVFSVVPGPGILNAGAAICSAADAPALIEVQLERTREVSPWGLLMPSAKRNDR
jgi:thiamine pyrophosphate-dependent acetolactate synthase large subunit-like protein